MDEEGILDWALSVFAEFSTKVRISQEDLDKERDVVLDEWRQSRDSAGRAEEEHWRLLLEGSKYADRMPIGAKEVIRNADAETARKFYRRFYWPCNMAIILVGDIDVDQAERAIKSNFSQLGSPKNAPSEPAPITEYQFQPHETPR